MRIGDKEVTARQMTADDLWAVGGISKALNQATGAGGAAAPEINVQSFVDIWPEIQTAAERLMSTPDQEVLLGHLPLHEAVEAVTQFALEWLQVNGTYAAEKIAPAVTASAQTVVKLVQSVGDSISQ